MGEWGPRASSGLCTGNYTRLCTGSMFYSPEPVAILPPTPPIRLKSPFTFSPTQCLAPTGAKHSLAHWAVGGGKLLLLLSLLGGLYTSYEHLTVYLPYIASLWLTSHRFLLDLSESKIEGRSPRYQQGKTRLERINMRSNNSL